MNFTPCLSCYFILHRINDLLAPLQLRVPNTFELFVEGTQKLSSVGLQLQAIHTILIKIGLVTRNFSRGNSKYGGREVKLIANVSFHIKTIVPYLVRSNITSTNDTALYSIRTTCLNKCCVNNYEALCHVIFSIPLLGLRY